MLLHFLPPWHLFAKTREINLKPMTENDARGDGVKRDLEIDSIHNITTPHQGNTQNYVFYFMACLRQKFPFRIFLPKTFDIFIVLIPIVLFSIYAFITTPPSTHLKNCKMRLPPLLSLINLATCPPIRKLRNIKQRRYIFPKCTGKSYQSLIVTFGLKTCIIFFAHSSLASNQYNFYASTTPLPPEQTTTRFD